MSISNIKRILCAGVVGAFLAAGTASQAASVNYNGYTFDDGGFGGTNTVSGSNLQVGSGPGRDTADNFYYGAAHYNTDAAFRSAATTFIEATLSDPGSGDAGFLAFEQEGGTHRSWAEIGVDADNSSTNYSLLWWNEVTNATDTILLGARTAGDHSLEIGRESSGTVDFLFDGSLVYSTTGITPDYIGDVYLFSQGSTPNVITTYTNYAAGTDFVVAPVPSAAYAGMALLGCLGAFGGIRRFRRTVA
ncbi:MAG TPA: hypothetical protein VFW23_01020 [Tepidisphaeraceae bacterium]|nr:hypothetical protein [Tepidisphaeraceae bacterium]